MHLLDGPDPRFGMESAASHRSRLGPVPTLGPEIIPVLEAADLRGRGGAGFPVGTKWRSIAQRGNATVLVNGAEGEPLSQKDRVLMETRPHLVLDGALLAARAVGAREIVLYIGGDHAGAATSIQRALGERPEGLGAKVRLLRGPGTYVAGEESAAVHFVNDGVALPTTTPPRPFERGIAGRPTLVQNVESLAHAALIARYGSDWFRTVGRGEASGSALITVSGSVANPGVIEVALGTPLAEAIEAVGGLTASPQALLVGGYFGGWVGAAEALQLPLDPAGLRSRGHSMGCGVVGVLPHHRCGVVETAGIMAYLAAESARQCGPCVFGLRAIAGTAAAIASARSEPSDLQRLQRWAEQLGGRGACRHPDGAAAFLLSGLRVFEAEFLNHHQHRRCFLTGAAWGAA